MAKDANVTHVEVLSALSSDLSQFAGSITKDTTVLTDVMSQKLAHLEHSKIQAQSFLKKIRQEVNNCFRLYASMSSSDDRSYVSMISNKLTELQRKEREASRLVADMDSQVNVARGMVTRMIADTGEFQNKVMNNIETGKRFVKSSIIQLQQYKESQTKI